MCRCPAHADRSPSLSVRVGDHALLFKCFASCDSRDVINEILRLEENALHHTDKASQASAGMPTDLWRRQQALRIWDEARPLIGTPRSEEHTSELQSLMRISYAVFCLKKKKL